MRTDRIHRVIILVAIFLTLSMHGCGQKKPGLRTYETQNYSIDYPSDWLLSNDEGIVNIYPRGNFGAVTLSYYSGITFPLEETKSLILEMSQIEDSAGRVTMTSKDGFVEFSHSYVNNKAHWFTKAIRRDSDFFLITINCNEANWENRKAEFFSVVDSFKIKSRPNTQ